MIIAHENVLTRMSAPTGSQGSAPDRALPNETYHRGTMKLSTHYHGGEAIELMNAPAAASDGDSLVWLAPRRCDRDRRHLYDNRIPED